MLATIVMILMIIWLTGIFIASVCVCFGMPAFALKELFNPEDTILNRLDTSRPVKQKQIKSRRNNKQFDFTSSLDVEVTASQAPVDNDLLNDLTSALVNLGYQKSVSKSIAKQTIRSHGDKNIIELVKLALQ